MVLMDTLKKWLDKGKEQAGDLSEKAKPMVEKSKVVAADAWDKGKEQAGDLSEKAKPMVDKSKDAATDAWAKTKDAAGSAKDKAASGSEDTADES